MAMMDSLKKDGDFQERIIERTFEYDPDIKDLADFQDALFSAFDTERGKRASKWFNGEEVAFLFETRACRDKLMHNISDEEYEHIYGELHRGDYDFKTIDKSIIDLKRIRKLEYSYESSGVICLPLTDAQFENFKAENVEMKQVLKDIYIKERGLLTRTYGLPEEELKNNVSKFMKEFS